MENEQPKREATILVDEVPTHLRELIPAAEEWGTWNPQRCDEILERKSSEELRPFVQLVEQHRDAIDTWLNSMPNDTKNWPAAALIFLALIRNWHEAACELSGRDNYDNAEPAAVPDRDGQ